MTEWWAITLAICTGATAIFTLWNLIEQRIKAAKSPTTTLDNRVTEIERKMLRYDEMFGRDKARLDSFDDSNRIILKSLLAIIKHDLDGNNVEALKQAQDDLQNYMLSK